MAEDTAGVGDAAAERGSPPGNASGRAAGNDAASAGRVGDERAQHAPAGVLERPGTAPAGGRRTPPSADAAATKAEHQRTDEENQLDRLRFVRAYRRRGRCGTNPTADHESRERRDTGDARNAGSGNPLRLCGCSGGRAVQERADDADTAGACRDAPPGAGLPQGDSCCQARGRLALSTGDEPGRFARARAIAAAAAKGSMFQKFTRHVAVPSSSGGGGAANNVSPRESDVLRPLRSEFRVRVGRA